MLWCWNNLMKGGSWATTNPSTAGYPVSNLLSNLASDVWRSGTANAAESITGSWNATLAFNSSLFPNYLILDGHNLDTTVSGNVTATISNSGANPFTVVFAPVAGTMLVAIPAQVANSFNQVVLSFTKTAAGTTAQIGKVFIGPTYESGAQGTPVQGDYDATFDEATNRDYSVGHQKFSEARAQFWSGHGAVPYATETIRQNLATMIAAVGTFNPFWVVFNNGDSIPEYGTPRYVTFSAVNKYALVEYGNGYLYGMDFNFEAQL